MTHATSSQSFKELLEEQSGMTLDQSAISMLHENFNIVPWLESLLIDQLTDLWLLAFPKGNKMPDESNAIAALNAALYLPDLHEQVRSALEEALDIEINLLGNTYIGYPNLQYVVDELQAM